MTVSSIILVCPSFLFQTSHFIVGDSSFHSQCHFVSLQCLKIFIEQDAPWPFWDWQGYLCALSKFNNTTQLGFSFRLFQASLYFRGWIIKREHQSVTPTLKSPNWIPAYYRHTHTVKDSQIHKGPWGMWAKSSRTQPLTDNFLNIRWWLWMLGCSQGQLRNARSEYQSGVFY